MTIHNHLDARIGNLLIRHISTIVQFSVSAITFRTHWKDNLYKVIMIKSFSSVSWIKWVKTYWQNTSDNYSLVFQWSFLHDEPVKVICISRQLLRSIDKLKSFLLCGRFPKYANRLRRVSIKCSICSLPKPREM